MSKKASYLFKKDRQKVEMQKGYPTVGIDALLAGVPDALRHLHRVTGKWGIRYIEPLDEKRWSKKCWECYNILMDADCRIMDGQSWPSMQREIVEKIRPTDGWLGSVETSMLPLGKPNHNFLKKFDKMFPNKKR